MIPSFVNFSPGIINIHINVRSDYIDDFLSTVIDISIYAYTKITPNIRKDVLTQAFQTLIRLLQTEAV